MLFLGKQTERQEMADNILERRDEINVVVTTYDMAFKKQDNSFLKKLRPNVCIFRHFFSKNANDVLGLCIRRRSFTQKSSVQEIYKSCSDTC